MGQLARTLTEPHSGLALEARRASVRAFAAATNASRVVRWLDGLPRAKTRVTRFAALAQAA